MNKIIASTITGIALVTILLAGCSQQVSRTVPVTTVTPPPSSIVVTSAPPAYSPTYSPSAAQSPPGTTSVIQNNLPLTLTAPADGAQLTADTIAVKGQTAPRAVVSVNDVSGVADSSGNFSVTVSLDQGPNAIDVVSTDNTGKEGEVLIMVDAVFSGPAAAASQPGQSGTASESVPLKVTKPLDGTDLTTDTVTVQGQTAQGATVVINDQVETADNNGNFSAVVSLVPGPNAIDVITHDDQGNENEVLIMVNVAS